MHIQHAGLGSLPSHYQRLGLPVHEIATWEDGLRTDPASESFEWWYFDCHLDDGSKLTVEFHTKPPFISPSKPLTPYVLFTWQQTDGTLIQKTVTTGSEEFKAARDHCDVRIGTNTFQGDLASYRIHVDIDGLIADIALRAEVPSWRPATGHAFFGDADEHYVAWFVAVPHGAVTARMTLGGVTRELRGAGYHDHNWGNRSLRKLVDHWYWGRARIADYTVVTLMGYSNETYGRIASPAFMLAKGNKIIVSSVDRVRFQAHDPDVVTQSGVPVSNRLCYDYQEGDLSYKVTFVRRADNYMLDFGAIGAYQRFIGDVILEHRVADQTQTLQAEALWELLYFGPRVRPT